MILRKSVKSLQLMLNESLSLLDKPTVSAAAFSKARKKLKHTAFIELNRQTILPATYNNPHQRWHKHRLLAIDGSKVILPDNEDIRSRFGTSNIKNNVIQSTYTHAMSSVLYDVKNKVALDARLVAGNSYEVTVALEHLPFVETDDIIILDRGYAAYHMLASVAKTKAHFVVRCGTNSFSPANDMVTGVGSDDRTVTLTSNPECRKKYGYSKTDRLTARFIRVVLDTGEIEVLATSLTDTEQYPTALFKDLYWQRWGIETFYNVLKNRLSLENFTGMSVESVLQDFHAMVFLSGLESALTEDIDQALITKQTKHKQQINKAVSIHAIKHRAFALFMSDVPIDAVIEELTELFLKSKTLYREGRVTPREKRTERRQLNFWKRKRKQVY